MRIPNADRAIIASEKLSAYLLNPSHKRGGSKAKLLLSLGYRTDAPGELERDLRAQHLILDFMRNGSNDYGDYFEISAPIETPSGRKIIMRSIWQIDNGTDLPRLITLYPG